MLFSRYVDEHLRTYGQDVVRHRHYVCPHCSTPVGYLDVAMKRLQEGKTDIGCLKCDDPGKRVPLAGAGGGYDEVPMLVLHLPLGSDEVENLLLELDSSASIGASFAKPRSLN